MTSLFPYLTQNVLIFLAGLVALLLVASVTTYIMKVRNPDKKRIELRQRVRSWWVIVGLLALSILLGRRASIFFFAFVSFLALKEYFSLIAVRRVDRRVLFWAYLAIPVQYYCIYTEWYSMFLIVVPVYLFLLLPFRAVTIGETSGFLKALSTIHWGVMMTVFSIGHLAYLMVLPADRNPVGGGPGLLLYIVALTELNDVAQFIWGKAIGNRKIIPKVSPNKTVAGFVGGVCTTTLLSFLLAPVLTPLSHFDSIVAGFMVGVSGFIGDVTVSAVKRDIGVKDSGSILPGHGGILDRIDSLTYTAPLFFHYLRYLYY